jgi:hypothetical protein
MLLPLHASVPTALATVVFLARISVISPVDPSSLACPGVIFIRQGDQRQVSRDFVLCIPSLSGNSLHRNRARADQSKQAAAQAAAAGFLIPFVLFTFSYSCSTLQRPLKLLALARLLLPLKPRIAGLLQKMPRPLLQALFQPPLLLMLLLEALFPLLRLPSLPALLQFPLQHQRQYRRQLQRPREQVSPLRHKLLRLAPQRPPPKLLKAEAKSKLTIHRNHQLRTSHSFRRLPAAARCQLPRP